MRNFSALFLSLALSGCMTTVWSPEDSAELQIYREDWSRAHNLLSLVYEGTEKLTDGTRCVKPDCRAHYFDGKITGVLKDDTLRVTHAFGFLPKDDAKDGTRAAYVFAEKVRDELRAVFEEKGYVTAAGESAITAINGKIRTRFSFFLERPEVGCLLPADRTHLKDVSEAASCRISVSTSAEPAGIGPYPTENGLSAIPNWAETELAFAWRVSDTRIESKVHVSEKSVTDLVGMDEIVRLSERLPDGIFVYSLDTHSLEPYVAEKGQVRRFIESPIGTARRLQAEEFARNGIYRKFNGAVKTVISPR